jgi:hypothetical protein
MFWAAGLRPKLLIPEAAADCREEVCVGNRLSNMV